MILSWYSGGIVRSSSKGKSLEREGSEVSASRSWRVPRSERPCSLSMVTAVEVSWRWMATPKSEEKLKGDEELMDPKRRSAKSMSKSGLARIKSEYSAAARCLSSWDVRKNCRWMKQPSIRLEKRLRSLTLRAAGLYRAVRRCVRTMSMRSMARYLAASLAVSTLER